MCEAHYHEKHAKLVGVWDMPCQEKFSIDISETESESVFNIEEIKTGS